MRRYRYVGPEDIRAASAAAPAGTPLRSVAEVVAWSRSAEPFTFVVDLEGTLRVAPRRSEHVACAAGLDVLAAGEITFDGDEVVEVTNQSTGYCPDVTCWPAVAAALDRIGVRHPPAFTAAFVFRRCEACAAISIVKDGDFTCPECEEPLPTNWNV